MRLRSGTCVVWKTTEWHAFALLAPSASPHNRRCCLQSGPHSHKSPSRHTAFVSSGGTAG